MFDYLIGTPWQEAEKVLQQAGVPYTAVHLTGNSQADTQIVVRITDAYHLTTMGFKLACTPKED